jgi:hypothetical protein
MFNSKLKQEIQQLREELMSIEQVKNSLDSEMLVLQLDPRGASRRSTATSRPRCSTAPSN